MSSPIHHAKDLDAALVYAPPWARDGAQPLPVRSGSSAIEWPRSPRMGRAIRGFSGDRAMRDLQSRLALNPDNVPEPPLEGAETLWPIALRTWAVAAVAALVAWAVVVIPGAKHARDNTQQPSISAPAISVSRDERNHVRVATAAWAARLPVHHRNEQANEAPKTEIVQVAVPQSVAVPAQAPMAAPQPAPKAAPQPAPVATIQPALAATIQPAPEAAPQPAPAQPQSSAPPPDSDEIAMLVKRGKSFLENGDLASARLLLRRAAESGNASAALALGATFDPLVIQRLGAVGAEPDPDKARKWYQKAQELGSDVASQQLAKLH